MADELKDAVLEELVADWAKDKKAERKATAKRIATEKLIQARLDAIDMSLPTEGSKTFACGELKITITTKINRKIADQDKLQEMGNDIPENLRPWDIVETVKLDGRGVKYLMENEPGIAAILAEFIEEKPAKPSFVVKEV